MLFRQAGLIFVWGLDIIRLEIFGFAGRQTAAERKNMELNEKILELRKQKGLTQEELAEALFVSRTAISKWESGRGYPSIDSLKALSKFFGVSVDTLISGDELLTVAQKDAREKESHFRDLMFGLLDCSTVMLFVLPFFGEKTEELVLAVSLLTLDAVSPWVTMAYFAVAAGITVWGIVLLALQNCQKAIWLENKYRISLLANAAGVLLFTVSLQPYAAVFLLIFLAIKVIILRKKG